MPQPRVVTLKGKVTGDKIQEDSVVVEVKDRGIMMYD